MKNPFGVMQGRLLPKYKGRYQAHPVGYWADEFPLAKSLGLDCIEFILDYKDSDLNPLSSDQGIDEILKVTESSGVSVLSICADYFMEAPFHSKNEEVRKKSQDVLFKLLGRSKELGVKDIVIPCVDQSSLKSIEDKDLFVEILKPILEEASSLDINLSLETDLPPQDFLKLIQKINHPFIKVNYDIGNSAALGFDPIEEFGCYGEYISDIHIKDRNLNSGSVKLGTGSADFGVVLDLIESLNYSGSFIMQAYRDDEGLEIFKKQLKWIRERMGKVI